MFTPISDCAALAITATLFTSYAFAQDAAKDGGPSGCDRLSWSVGREHGWFDDARLPRRESGARLRQIDRAVELDLRPTPDVHFFLSPVHEPKSDSFSGVVAFFGVPRLGRYQVTLSEEASVEVFENGTRLKPVGRVSGKSCPGIRESVRFDLAPGNLVLVEVIGAPTRTIKVALAEAR